MNKVARFIFVSFLVFVAFFSGLKAQTCLCNNYGPDLIVNGNFSLGNTGFTSDYIYSTTNAGSGKYGISATPWTANLFWSHCTDHTTGTGNLMWVDCATTGSLNIWTQTVPNLNLNTDYLFTCWIANIDLNGPATLLFSINGQGTGDSLTAPATTCSWIQYCFVWNSGSNNSATISIINQTQFGVGNDVLIDDISFTACCAALSIDQFPSICSGDNYLLPGGITVSSGGVYYDTLDTYIGCDSVLITHLSVLATSSHSQNISICNGQSYFAGGAFQTTSGTYSDVLVNALGCDSFLTTNLTVLPNSSNTINPSICQGQSYFAGGAFQINTGTYIDTLINYLGCDSVLTTNLTVLPNSAFTVNASICSGQSYLAGGALQTATGIYFDTLINYLGCDSVITTNLTVFPNSFVTVNPSVCDGQSWFAAGALQTTSGVYLDTFVNYVGCDSVVTTNLTVLANTAFTNNVSICDGQSYFAGGALQTLSGTYTDTLVNAVGCDSVLTTNLTVLPNSSFSQNVSICFGDSIFLGGAWQTVSGSYTDHYTNYLGCDSALTTNLTVLLNSTNTVNAAICLGQSYFVGGAFQTTSGTYFDTLINYIGCDSILITNLAVLSTSFVTVNPAICDGQSYFAGGALQTTSGVYLDTFANFVGCDSVVTTNLTVIANTAFTNNVSICDGQTYFAAGAFQTQSGIYLDTVLNAAGCDSVITTNLTVLPNSSFAQNVSICLGDSLFVGGAWQTQSGSYIDHYTNYLGCDSAFTTNLTVLPTSALTVNAAICNGQSYFAGDAWQTTTGIYFDTLINYLGCDSVVTTNLAVLLNTATTVNASICDGQSYFVGGAFQTTSGVYVDSLSNFVGCDSVVTTNLTVLANTAFTNNVSICDGQTYYAAGAFQTQSGVYLDTLSNAVGCDSVITTNLTVLPNSSSSQNVSICLGDSLFVGGAWQIQSGSYVDHYTNYLGCDSAFTTNLTVLPTSALTVNAAICNGQSYFAGGAWQTTTGIYFDTLVNYLGCDSVVTTNLTVLLNTATTVNASICDGQSYFAGGAFQTMSGVYIDSLSNFVGCDSVVTTNLTVLANTAFTKNVSICDGQSYNAGGGLQTQSGVYFDTLVNAVGCDSVITTNLTVLLNSFFTQNASICFGDSIYLGGAWQTQSGNYIDHYTNYVGCDSTLTTILFAYPLITTQVDTTICNEQTYYAGGTYQSQSGIYADTLIAVSGCDSIVNTALTVLPPNSTDLYPIICSDQQYFAGGNWQSTTGIYFDTLSSYLGCDSAVITHLTVNPAPVIDLGNDTAFCEGESMVLNAGSGFQDYAWQDQSSQSSLVANERGTYWVTVTNSFGCSSSDTLEVTDLYALPSHFLPPDTFICGNLPLKILVAGFMNYLWSNGDINAYYVFTEEGNYSLQVTDSQGCTATETISINNICDQDIMVPNTFTPNGDGLNDIFLPIIIKNLQSYYMQIFNRWGIKVFESHDPSVGWNGIDNSLPGEVGAYVWSLDYATEDGKRRVISGYITLLR